MSHIQLRENSVKIPQSILMWQWQINSMIESSYFSISEIFFLFQTFLGCLDNQDQSPCTTVYNCENYNFNQYGKCLGPCKTKWIGQYCLSRGSIGD